MAMNEWRELLRVLDASASEREPDASLLALLIQSFGGGEGLDTSFLPRVAVTAPVLAQANDAPPTELPVNGALRTPLPYGRGSEAAPERSSGADFAAEVLRSGTQPVGTRGLETFVFPRPVAAAATPGASFESQPDEKDNSTAKTVLKTIGMATGVGPIVTGLMKLFGGGSGSEEAALPALPFSLPEQISVEAGLAQDRSFVPVSYSQRGVARPAMAGQRSEPAAAQISVNVQAMDSRSFLDHSDEIARAVRDAMLRSHSLNDVVAEI